MPTTALRETFGHCSRFTEPWNATGAKCCKAAAGTASISPGRSSARSRRDVHCCVQSCDFLTESCRPSQCCEPPVEERGAGKPHATFCGNRGRATAPGDPVRLQQCDLLTRHIAMRLRHAEQVAGTLPIDTPER